MKNKIKRFYIRQVKYWYIRYLIDRLFTKIWNAYLINDNNYDYNLHRCTLCYLASDSIDYTLLRVMNWWGMDSITEEEKKYSKLN